MRIGEAPGSNVRELIRAAEKFIASGEYNVALDQLMNARKIQPGNAYIAAIMERVQSLQTEKERGEKAAVDGARNPLEVTVSDDFPNGIREKREEHEPTAKEIEIQVRRLTTLAQTLFERGSCESAFESLMKAYLLDPVSPYVLACEQDLLPAWELLKKREGNRPSPTAGSGVDLRKSESARLEALKQQRELERIERERALWREASMPPRVIQQNPFEPNPLPESAPDLKKSARWLLTKFRFGRISE